MIHDEDPGGDALPPDLDQALRDSDDALAAELHSKLSIESGLAAILQANRTADAQAPVTTTAMPSTQDTVIDRASERAGQMRFRMLGPLEVRSEEGWTGISAGKWRSLLACLLLRQGQFVAAETLIEELWGNTPPATANNLVSIYAHRLRSVIGDSDGHILVQKKLGYQLRVAHEDTDARAFEALVADARRMLADGNVDVAVALLREAEGLWRGEFLTDVAPTALVSAESKRMTKLRLAATELRIGAHLMRAQYTETVPELRSLVAEHPLREGLWLLLMRALNGAGRHAEALETYGQARQVIADKLGVNPGRELQQFYRELLAGDYPDQAWLAQREELTAAETNPRRSAVPGLTQRELGVLVSLCRPALSDNASFTPATAPEIASDLVVSEALVKQYLLRLYQKFHIAEGPNRRTRLASEVITRGLVRPSTGQGARQEFPGGQLAPQPTAETARQFPLAGENCTVVLTEIVEFAAHERNDRDRLIIRDASLDMMRTTLGHLWEECIPKDQGDGLMLIVPPAIPTMKIMERLHRELPGKLRQHNRTYRETARIRLRVAADVGPVVSDAVGVSGEAIVRASRLLDAPVLKDAMASTGASLGLIVSTFVYDTAIKHAEEWADPVGYKAVETNVKETRIPARMRVIDPSPRAQGDPSQPVQGHSAHRGA